MPSIIFSQSSRGFTCPIGSSSCEVWAISPATANYVTRMTSDNNVGIDHVIRKVGHYSVKAFDCKTLLTTICPVPNSTIKDRRYTE